MSIEISVLRDVSDADVTAVNRLISQYVYRLADGGAGAGPGA